MALLPSLVQSVLLSFGDISSYYQLYYFVGYGYGFGGRKLVGTLVSPLLPGTVGHAQLLPVIWGANAALLVLGWVLLLRAWRVGQNSRHAAAALMGLSVVWLLSPFSPSAYFGQGINLMFPEVWQMIAAMVFMVLYASGRRGVGYWVVAALCCVAGLLTHHVFCCLFLPAMAALMVADVLAGDRVGIGKAVGYSLLGIGMVALFVAVWTGGSMNVGIDQLYDEVTRRAPAGIVPRDKDGAFRQLYYISSGANAAQFSGSFRNMKLAELAVTVVLALPLVVALLAPFAVAVKGATTRIARVRYLLLLVLPTLMHLPVYWMACDYGRWEYAWVFGQMAMILALSAMRDEGMLGALRMLTAFARRHKVVCIAAVLWLAALPAATAWQFPLAYKIAAFLL